MIDPTLYKYLCRDKLAFPAKANEKLRPEVFERLGEDVSVLFPAFARAFPLTIKAMESNWSKPFAAIREGSRTKWVVLLALERAEKNLFFNTSAASPTLDGADYEQSYGILPTEWRELFRYFHSFQITERSTFNVRGWKDTPHWKFTLEDFYLYGAIKPAKAVPFLNKYALNEHGIGCYLWTSAGDSLWIDEVRRDHKVYHVRGDSFEDAFVLSDAAGKLDHYMSKIVTSGEPEEFDFRAS